jgi:hypothetical protein
MVSVEEKCYLFGVQIIIIGTIILRRKFPGEILKKFVTKFPLLRLTCESEKRR